MTILEKWRDSVAQWRDSVGHTDSTTWKKVLVPALGRPYSGRAVEVACRLAKTSGAQLYLAYVMEVPRAFMLDASLPEAECQAADTLADAQRIVEGFRIHPIPIVHRVRNPRDGILKLITQEQIDLLVLGVRPDEVRGLPKDLSRELARQVSCEVVIDYIADEQ